MADITVTIPNSTFTITQVSSGIEVTTPTDVVVDVTSGTNTIDVTSTPNEITVTEVGITNTDQLIEGTTNLFFTTARARSSISVVDTGGDGSLSYNTGSGVITYTGPSASEVRAHFSAGTGISIVAGEISVTGQQPTTVLTTSATTADQVVDTFSATAYRTAKYLVSITSGSSYQAMEILITHDGTTASQTIYADIATASNLASFTVDISGGLVRLLTTPVNAVTVYKVIKTTIVV